MEARGGIHQRLDRNIRIGSINGEPEFSASTTFRSPTGASRGDAFTSLTVIVIVSEVVATRQSRKRNLMDSRGPCPSVGVQANSSSSRIEGRTNRQPGRTVGERLRGHIRIRSRDGKPEFRAFVHRPVADWLPQAHHSSQHRLV